jgi:hypothetical protein
MKLNLNSAAGFTVEQVILESLQCVYRVIPTANIRTNGRRGPGLDSKEDHTTLADAMIFPTRTGDRHGWIEIKAKSRCNRFHNLERDEHGIDAEKFREYCKLQVETGMTVYLLFCELETGDMLMADLDTLRSCSGRPRIGVWPDNGKRSVNWDRKVFAKVGMFKVENGDLRKSAVVWDRKILASFLSQLELPFRKEISNEPIHTDYANVAASNRC